MRHCLSIIVAAVFATLAAPQVWDLAHTIFVKEPSGHWIVEPWYYTGTFWRLCLLLFICDFIRQVILRKLFFVRAIIESVLVATAWANRHYWFYPEYGIFVIAVGGFAAYLVALVGDVAAVAKFTKTEPNQALEPTTTAGTSAAEQPRVPAAVVAHL